MVETIESVFKIITSIPYPWNYTIAVFVFAVLAAPKLITLRGEWLDYRLGRRRIGFEKEKLELIKLHYEIEAIKKKGNLGKKKVKPGASNYEEQIESQFASPEFEYTKPKLFYWFSKLPRREAKPWGWLKRYPRAGRVILTLIQITFLPLAYIFGLATAGIVVVWFTTPTLSQELGVPGLIVVLILYLAITAGFYKGYRVAGHWKSAL